MSRADPRPPNHAETARHVRARRISYFMLVRLAMLAGFTVLVGAILFTKQSTFDRVYVTLVTATLIVGYILTIVYARLLRHVRDLSRFASIQTATDIIFAAVTVQMSGGVDSGFVTLYLISVLGASTMGGPRQTWAAAGACTLIYLVMSMLEYLGLVVPMTLSEYVPLGAREHWGTAARTVAGLAGVTVLSSYLNTQLVTSASQVGALRALNENIVRSLNSGLVTLDRAGRLLYFNPAARAILELEDEQISTSVTTIFPGLPPAFSGDNETRQELELTTASGRHVHVGLSRAPLIDEQGQHVGQVINFQDVSRLHELTQKVRRSERLAAVGGLAASVAHEIRNPLAAISGSAELLSGANLSDEDGRLLAIIRRESNRLSDMVTDLLAFTRPHPPQPMPSDLALTVNNACEAFGADPANAEITVAAQATEEIVAKIDVSQLAQVLWNLLRNAADAMDGAGTIEVRVEKVGGLARIEVADQGPGIAQENLERIFDPFFTTKSHGTGFGLAIVHRIVRDNGGTISVTSAAGVGSTFTLSFPEHGMGRTPAEPAGLGIPEDLGDDLGSLLTPPPINVLDPADVGHTTGPTPKT